MLKFWVKFWAYNAQDFGQNFLHLDLNSRHFEQNFLNFDQPFGDLDQHFRYLTKMLKILTQYLVKFWKDSDQNFVNPVQNQYKSLKDLGSNKDFWFFLLFKI